MPYRQRQPIIDPTPEQIREATRRIREGWTELDHERRRFGIDGSLHHQLKHWSPPQVSIDERVERDDD